MRWAANGGGVVDNRSLLEMHKDPDRHIKRPFLVISDRRILGNNLGIAQILCYSACGIYSMRAEITLLSIIAKDHQPS
jgi:hypothetical protein